MSVDTLRAPTSGSPEIAARPLLSHLESLPSDEPRRSRWGVPATLSALALASLWLRTRGLPVHYWIDEGLSVGIASHPLAQIPSLLRQDGSPPLYYLLLHLSMSLFGRSEVATHELSLCFALLTIPVGYWAGASLFDRRSGLVCAVLAAGAPYLTTYADETRMYALLALLGVVVAGSFVHVFVFRRRSYLPVFAGSLLAALYTHNWALFLALMTAVGFVVCLREAAASTRRSLWLDGALAFGSVALLYAPWIPTLVYQAHHTGAPWDLPPVVWSLSQGLYSLVGGRGAAIAMLLAGGSGLLAVRRATGAQRQRSLAVTCLLILSIGTLLVAWIYSKTAPAWADRYFAVIVGPLIVLFGLGLARAGRLGLVALALTLCFWILDPTSHKLDTKSNVAAAIAAVRPHLRPGTLALSTQPEQVPTLAYYLPGVKRFGTPLGPVPDPKVVDWRGALARLRGSSIRATLMPMVRSLSPGQRLLLVVPTDLPSTPRWLRLINLYSRQWARALEHDRSLVRVRATSAGARASGVPVRATLYLVR